MPTHAKTPHLRLPFQVGPNGSAHVLEQDTYDEIAQSVEVLLRTRLGERLEVPDYGVPDMLFDVAVDKNVIVTEIEEWEPRVSSMVEQNPDQLDELIRHVRVGLDEERA